MDLRNSILGSRVAGGDVVVQEAHSGRSAPAPLGEHMTGEKHIYIAQTSTAQNQIVIEGEFLPRPAPLGTEAVQTVEL